MAAVETANSAVPRFLQLPSTMKSDAGWWRIPGR